MKLTKTEKQRCADIASLLASAFDWSEAPEGYEYWMKVADRLEELAEGVEPQV